MKNHLKDYLFQVNSKAKKGVYLLKVYQQEVRMVRG